ncbi:MAG: ABC transporter permease [Dehalococcoidia bacterium]|nr:ABC transporter permease [Dehalococcoidia bacterium]
MSPLPTASVLAAELLKVRKRWLPYLLLGIMLVGVALIIWLAGYANWLSERNEAEYDYGRDSLRAFALPWSLPTLLDMGQFYGAVLVSVLVASAVATEYNWGTVRQALVRGQTRNQYLFSKLAGLTVLSVAGLLLALAIGLLFSVLATVAADLPVTLDAGDGGSITMAEAVLMIVRSGYGALPYVLLAFCLTIIGRSTTLGIVGTLLYMFVIEAILVAVLGGLGGAAAATRAVFLGHNVNALITANRIQPDDCCSLAPRDMTALPSELPDPWVAAIVVALYCAVFLSVAFYVFRRRDLGTDGGGG